MFNVNKKFKVACVPMNSQDSIDYNILSAKKKIHYASNKGAKLVVLPENAIYMNKNNKDYFSFSFPESLHPGVIEMKNIANELNIWILIGSVNIKFNKKIYNRSILIDGNGEIKKRYDKIHLFSAKLPDGSLYDEKKYIESGKNISLHKLPWGVLGMTICYDLRFPYLFRKLALKGADFISVPSAFTKFTGNLHWHSLLKARAIENGCYIFAAAQKGKHPGKRETFGHSLIVDPWGKVLSDSGSQDKALIKEIDLQQVSLARTSIPSLKHTRKI